MGMYFTWSSDHEVSVTGAEGAKEGVIRHENRGTIAGGRQIMEGLVDHCKDFGFFSG